MKLNTSVRKRFRVSNKVKRVASKDRFRLSIARSSKNISAQIIDDIKKITLLSSSSIDKNIKGGEKVSKIEISKKVAFNLAKKAQEKKITKIQDNTFINLSKFAARIYNLSLMQHN